jgi:hypothetical protein
MLSGGLSYLHNATMVIEDVSSVELDVGAVVGIGSPVRRDDVVGHHHLARVAEDVEGEGAFERVVRVNPPDVAP